MHNERKGRQKCNLDIGQEVTICYNCAAYGVEHLIPFHMQASTFTRPCVQDSAHVGTGLDQACVWHLAAARDNDIILLRLRV